MNVCIKKKKKPKIYCGADYSVRLVLMLWLSFLKISLKSHKHALTFCTEILVTTLCMFPHFFHFKSTRFLANHKTALIW